MHDSTAPAGDCPEQPKKQRKTSTHPSEATYPCCIPALGELGDIAPRGGSYQCTSCPDTGASRAAHR
ncbi:hypothetical protein BBSC_2301 [Bifidobacterium scardovii JCM 12489 = DSM 13734]|nr:hypothetical protein BBSC_2301 [Bifidobacterium scardovii JCM 12489 = DSM 13734]